MGAQYDAEHWDRQGAQASPLCNLPIPHAAITALPWLVIFTRLLQFLSHQVLSVMLGDHLYRSSTVGRKRECHRQEDSATILPCF